MTVKVFGHLILISRDFSILFLSFLLRFTFDREDIIIKHERLCMIILKHLEIRQKYSAARRIFNSLLSVWNCGKTRYFMLVILLSNTCTANLYSHMI